MNTPSLATQILVTVIPIVGIVFGSVVLFFYIYFGYRTKILMIEKGIYKSPIEVFDLETFALLLGILSFSIGSGMSIFFYFREGLTYGLLGGLIPFFVGAGLIVFFIIRMKMQKKHDG